MAAQQIHVVVFFLFSFSLARLLDSPSVAQEISAQFGEDFEPQCRGPEDGKVLVLEWIRTDLGSEGYLHLNRDGVMDHYQHQFFKNRVELRDPQMKKGDVSLILKNVTLDDSAMYKCWALFETSEGEQEILQEFSLTVTEAEPSVGGANIKIIGGVFGAVGLVLVLVFVLIKCCRKQKKSPEESDAESSFHRENEKHVASVKHGSLPRKESKALLLFEQNLIYSTEECEQALDSF